MSLFRTVFLLFATFVALFSFGADRCDAQMEKLDYSVGDLIEVDFLGDWHEAKVIEIMPGARALRVEFVPRLNNGPREFMFTSRSIRDIEVEKADKDETGSDENPFIEEDSDANPFVEEDSDNNPFVEEKTDRRRSGRSSPRAQKTEESNPFTNEIQTNERSRRSRPSRRAPSRIRPESEQRSQRSRSPFGSESTTAKDSSKVESPKRSTPRNAVPNKMPPANSRMNTTVESRGLSAWRWISFGVFACLGAAVGMWGWISRSLYW